MGQGILGPGADVDVFGARNGCTFALHLGADGDAAVGIPQNQSVGRPLQIELEIGGGEQRRSAAWRAIQPCKNSRLQFELAVCHFE